MRRCIEETANTVQTLQHAHEVARAFQANAAVGREIYASFMADERGRIAEAAHRRERALERRKKELLEDRRATLEAAHSLEAAEKFKALKFKLGRARMLARRGDAEVDSKTAEAAAIKIACELVSVIQSQSLDVATWFDQRIARVNIAIAEMEADGADTAAQRAAVELLRRVKAMVEAG